MTIDTNTIGPSLTLLDNEAITAPQPQNQTFDNTDTGNGQRLVSLFGHEIRYIATSKTWLIYDGTIWKADKTHQIREKAMATANSIYDEAKLEADNRKASEVAGWATKSRSATLLKNMIWCAQSSNSIALTEDQTDLDNFLLNTRNGTLDLRTCTLRAHNPDDLITRVVPVPYNPHAKYPLWMKFMEEVTCQDATLQRYIQKVVGYCLTGDMREQVFFVLFGQGSNGKSIFIKTITSLLGTYATTANFTTFLKKERSGPRSDLARLKGFRFVAGSEVGIGEHLDGTVMKQITGGDAITERNLYEGELTFEPVCKVFLAANHKPRIPGGDEGMWRRPIVLPWDATFKDEHKDMQLSSKLLAELEGILAWAVEGCRLWQAEGLKAPQRILDAIDEYRLESDETRRFVREWCLVAPNEEERSSDLYNHYTAWCEEEGLKPDKANLFGRRLTEMGYTIKKGATNRRLGIRSLCRSERDELGRAA